jgi:hypothetical protein
MDRGPDAERQKGNIKKKKKKKKTTAWAKTFITYFYTLQKLPNILAADVFATRILSLTCCHKTDTCPHPCPSSITTFSLRKFQGTGNSTVD